MSVKFIVINLLILVNLFGFFINLADKQAAIHNKSRIPEKTLWLIGIIGGACGSYLGMKIFHHKTKHMSFMVGMPLLSIIQVAIIIFAFKNWL
jgi:uncharacterized membrane protein YsdA (DUF1294 family)